MTETPPAGTPLPSCARTQLDPEDLPSSNMRQLFEMWQAKRALRDGGLPARADFDPSEMPQLLPRIAILEVRRAEPDLIVRLAGTAITDRLGTELTGWHLDSSTRTDDGMTQAGWWAAENGAPVLLPRARLSRIELAYREFAVLALPLASDGQRVDRLLILFEFDI